MDIIPKPLDIQDTAHRPHEAQEEGRPKSGCFGPSYKEEENTHWIKYEDKVQSRDWRKGHPENVPTRDSSQTQSSNTYIIVDAKNCLLEGP